MARLHTVGFESQIFSSTANQHGEGDFAIKAVQTNGTVTVDTTNPRSGAACASQAGGAANYTSVDCGAGAADRAYFLRAYLRFSDATPTAQMRVLGFQNGSSVAATIRLNTDGTLTLHQADSTQIGSASAALSDNTWYRVEMKVIIPAAGNGTLEGKLNGTTFATSAAAAITNVNTSAVLYAGCITAAGSGTILVDDVAMNDDTGADQNSYPGSGKVIVLRPAAHSNIGTWVGPQTTGDDTTDLWDNVNNTPPQGVAHSDTDANAGKYVFNITNAANQDFDMAIAAYDTQIAAGDSITLTQGIARMSVDSTTGTNTGTVEGVSNPAMTARTGFNLEATAVAGTEPAGWKSARTAVAYAPAVTRSTQPVLRARKVDASTRANMIDLMGVLVEYVPAVTTVSRSASLDATAAVAASGTVTTTLSRSALVTAASGIASVGDVLDIVIRSAAFSMTSAISAEAQGVRTRTAALDAIGSVSSAGEIIYARSATLAAASNIISHRDFDTPNLWTRRAQIDGITGISSRGVGDLHISEEPRHDFHRLAATLELDPGMSGFADFVSGTGKLSSSSQSVSDTGESWTNTVRVIEQNDNPTVSNLGFREYGTTSNSETYEYSTGPGVPNFAQSLGGGLMAWQNVNNVLRDDGLSTIRGGVLAPPGTSEWLFTSVYGLPFIPEDATILGVQHVHKRKSNPAFGHIDTDINLIVGDVIQGTNHAFGAGWPSGYEYAVFGAPWDKWGIALEPGHINSPTFGVAVKSSNAPDATSAGEIDCLFLEVFYSRTFTTDTPYTIDHPQTSQSLNLKGFGFDVPTNAKILGVTAQVRRKRDSLGVVTDHTVQLLKNGVASGNNKADPNAWPIIYGIKPYGNANDKWGLTLGPSDVNDPDFGIRIRAQGLYNAQIDHVTLEVHYSVEGQEVAFTSTAVPLHVAPDSDRPSYLPVSASFDTEMPGGFSAGTITVPNSEEINPIDYLYATTRIYEYETNTTLHEGRVVGASESLTEVGFELEGWAKHLQDDKTARMIFYDRDHSRWKGASTQRKLDTFDAAYNEARVSPDRDTGEPALELALTGPQTDWPGISVSDGWYDGEGIELKYLDYAWKRNSNLGSAAPWSWFAQFSDNDLLTTPNSSAELVGTGPGSGTLTAAAGKRWARVTMAYTAGPGGDTTNVDYSLFWTLLGVVGQHTVPLVGTVSAPSTGRGVTVDETVRYIVERWAPEVRIDSLEETSFVLPHLVYYEATTAFDMIEALVLYGGDGEQVLDWYVYDDRKLSLASPDSHGKQWRTRWEPDGTTAEGSGPDVQRLINGVVVSYDDGTGTVHAVGPPGSDAEYIDDALISFADTNFANRDGAKHWEKFDAGITSLAGALLIGQLILAERNRQEWRGNITVEDRIRDADGAWHPVSLIRAGDHIVVEDDDDPRPRRIVNTSYDSNTKKNSVSVGAPPDRLEVLLARAGIVIAGRI